MRARGGGAGMSGAGSLVVFNGGEDTKSKVNFCAKFVTLDNMCGGHSLVVTTHNNRNTLFFLNRFDNIKPINPQVRSVLRIIYAINEILHVDGIERAMMFFFTALGVQVFVIFF